MIVVVGVGGVVCELLTFESRLALLLATFYLAVAKIATVSVLGGVALSARSDMVSSPSSFTLLQELEDHLNSDDFSPNSSCSRPLSSLSFHHTNASSELLQQAMDLFSQSCSESPDLEALFAADSGEEAAFDLGVLDQNLCFGGGDLTLDLESKKQQEQEQHLEEQEQEVVVDRQVDGYGDGYGDEEEEGEDEEEEEEEEGRGGGDGSFSSAMDRKASHAGSWYTDNGIFLSLFFFCFF